MCEIEHICRLALVDLEVCMRVVGLAIDPHVVGLVVAVVVGLRVETIDVGFCVGSIDVRDGALLKIDGLYPLPTYHATFATSPA